MHDVIDMWDPNSWSAYEADHEFRIYGHNNAQVWAVVDEIDYRWAIQWCWCLKKDARGSMYLRRAVGENANGRRLRTFTLYLHIEIHKRAKKKRPSRYHVLVDHRDGDSLNCRRSNLRWATYSMNGYNRYGNRAGDLVEDTDDALQAVQKG